MKVLIIYASRHHGNTEKIALVIADELNAELVKADEADIDTLENYDLIGLGSGIYWGKHDKQLLDLVAQLPMQKNKRAFIFSTHGLRAVRFSRWFNRRLKKQLIEKGFTISGEFNCRGFDTIGPLKLIGGVNKGRPNKEDLAAARTFARVYKF